MRGDLRGLLRYNPVVAPHPSLPEAGSRVRITVQTPLRDQTWSETIEGEVLRSYRAPTGSWFQGSRDQRLWLDRVDLRLADGEISTVNLDQYTHVEELDATPTALPPDEAAGPACPSSDPRGCDTP
jgi:hypothetical protein